MSKSEAVHQKRSKSGKGATSNQQADTRDWKKLWRIKAPPKMRIVLWRFTRNYLPTGQQLQSRNIPASEVCCHCGREETIDHVFLKCHYVGEIWRELKNRCGFAVRKEIFRYPKQWLFDRLIECTDQEATTLAISFWHIWEERNAVRNGEKEIHPPCVVEKILAYVDMVVQHLYTPHKFQQV